MARILINLLPPEILALKKKDSKFYKVQLIGTIAVSIIVFLTSVIIALRLMQNYSLNNAQEENQRLKQRIAELNNTQLTLLILKNRLQTISKYWAIPSKQSELYMLISQLTPPQAVVSAITIDKEGEGNFIDLIPDSTTLDTFVNNLTSAEQNQGKINQVSIDNLSRGKDGYFRINLKVKH